MVRDGHELWQWFSKRLRRKNLEYLHRLIEIYELALVKFYIKMFNEGLTESIYKEFRDLIEKHFPNIFIRTSGYAGLDFHADQATDNYLFRNTKYFYDGELKFIHWTSLSNLLSILNYREIRLYNLYNSEDKDEFNYSASALGLTSSEIDHAKHHYYTFSFSKKEDLNNPYLWREYGKKYKGVALEFSIINDPKEWDNFMISKVYYEIPNNFAAFNNEISELKKKYDAKFRLNIGSLIGFHKKPDYNLENEVRIATFFPYTHHEEILKYVKTDFRIDSENRRNRITNYISLPLWENHDNYSFKSDKPELDRRTIMPSEYFKTHPKISLDNIYFGSECGITHIEFGLYKRTLEEMILFNLGYRVELEWNFMQEP